MTEKQEKTATAIRRKSAILNVRTIKAAQQEVPPYDEVMAFLAEQREATRDDDLLLLDEDAVKRLPEEMLAEMVSDLTIKDTYAYLERYQKRKIQ